MSIPILRLRGEDGEMHNVIAIRGEKGEAGQDGNTPVKGVDYFTDEDKAYIVNEVISALPDGDEVGY